MSCSESSRPKLAFSPRSIAPCSESWSTPGSNFPGTLPWNELCDCGAAGLLLAALPLELLEEDEGCAGAGPATACACVCAAPSESRTIRIRNCSGRAITNTSCPGYCKLDEGERFQDSAKFPSGALNGSRPIMRGASADACVQCALRPLPDSTGSGPKFLRKFCAAWIPA